jgi:hypothetical protein
VRVSSGFAGWRWRARWLTGFLVAMGALPVLAAGPASAATAPPWTILVTQNPAGFNNLEGVSCPSATRCVAAGFDETASVETVLPETWNGTIWQVPTLVKGDPLHSASSSFLTGVSCPVTTKCEMVGRLFDAHGNTLPLAAVWNGFLGKASVASQPVPLPPGANFGALSGVSCTSVNACIAVGDFGSATGGGALAERWDGSRWQLIQTGLAAGGTSAQFNAVSCTSAATCTAVGIFKTFSRTFDTLAERFVAAGSPHALSLTSRGTVLALLRKPRTLELLVFQRGRHGHLLGPVALGSHPAGCRGSAGTCASPASGCAPGPTRLSWSPCSAAA